MSEAEKEANELIEKFYETTNQSSEPIRHLQVKQCALVCVETKYHALREMLFNLRACRIIQSKTYLLRLEELNEIEKKVKEIITNKQRIC